MKKGSIIAAAAVLLIGSGIAGSIWYGKSGHISGAEITLEHSGCFSDSDIQAAADAVLNEFQENRNGCRLKSLRYENGRSAGGEYAEPACLTLYSDFYAYPVIGSDETICGKQNGWSWILKKNDSGVWEIVTYGYA